MLSIKLIKDVCNSLLLVISSSSKIKKRKRINKIGEPYKMPIFIKNYSNSPLIILIFIIYSFRKLITYYRMKLGIPFICRLSRSLIYKTLLKTPAMSIYSIIATYCWPKRF
jgi:hypothetical protein